MTPIKSLGDYDKPLLQIYTDNIPSSIKMELHRSNVGQNPSELISIYIGNKIHEIYYKVLNFFYISKF